MLHRFVLLLVLFLWGSGLHQVRAQEEARKPLRIDTNHSTLGFSVPIVGGLSQVTGKFTDFDVQIIWDEADPAASSVQATLQVASIDTGIDDRDSDLQSPNFFDVATYPTLTFESDHIEQQGEGFLAHGTLTMKGVSERGCLAVPGAQPLPVGWRYLARVRSRLYPGPDGVRYHLGAFHRPVLRRQ